ncbi:hypothetical protein DLAC_10740 [Tieghemostelium lacteum]|uniref:Uncharacterized protein n=1 Tax=Tieghemostelium lacteum TaxID=361077 RepID=A0A151Z474_TIELA|nr:hypothetical protein DLAC_10740 [Tieghemostelium lacteum]|eukprot:KYQ88717.1 hypothetical protein DLAC_10740 [Tieghemostelium lacteum]
MIKTQDANLIKQKGNIELWNKNYSKALTYFNEALELDPTNIEFHLSKAAAYNLSGLFSNAIKECKVTLDLSNKKKLEFQSKEIEETSIEVLNIEKLIAKAYARMSTAYLGANQFKESKNCIENAMNQFQTEELEQMFKKIQELTQLSTKEAKDLFTLANEAYYAKNFESAIQLYSEAIQIDPKNNILFSNRSMCLNKLKRYEEALNDAEKAIKIENKDNHHSYLPRYAKGNSLYFLKRYAEALESFQDALKNKPDSPVLQKKIKKTQSKIITTGQGSSIPAKKKLKKPSVQENNNSNNVVKEPIESSVEIPIESPLPNQIKGSGDSIESNLETSEALKDSNIIPEKEQEIIDELEKSFLREQKKLEIQEKHQDDGLDDGKSPNPTDEKTTTSSNNLTNHELQENNNDSELLDDGKSPQPVNDDKQVEVDDEEEEVKVNDSNEEEELKVLNQDEEGELTKVSAMNPSI